MAWQQARDLPRLFGQRAGAGSGSDVQDGDRFTAEGREQLAGQESGRRLAGASSAAQYDDARGSGQRQSGARLIALQLIRLAGPVAAWDDDHALVPAVRPGT